MGGKSNLSRAGTAPTPNPSPPLRYASWGRGTPAPCSPHEGGTNGERCLAHIFNCQTAVRLAAQERVASRQKKIGPCSVAGRGDSPDFRLLPSPLESRGLARRQGALPGLLRAVSGLLRTLGARRCTPRLAARQRGILAFMPLTVVGPGRLLVADEAARVRPGDKGCVKSFARRCRSRSPPTRRLMNAPLVEWIGIGAA